MAGLIPRRRAPAPRREEERLILEAGGLRLPLRLRRHPRARRLTLRIDPAGDGALITLPVGTPAAEALAMARGRLDWLCRRMADRPAAVPFVDGAEIPVLGRIHAVRHRPDRRGTTWRENAEIHVAGRPEFLARRLTDWLKAEARREIAARVPAKATALGRKPGRITLRDTRWRWGSCSAAGNLSFCWRLILAPAFVLDYVVAHEVAHLAVRGHTPEFWRTVDRLTEDTAGARAWLRQHGAALHRYGAITDNG